MVTARPADSHLRGSGIVLGLCFEVGEVSLCEVVRRLEGCIGQACAKSSGELS